MESTVTVSYTHLDVYKRQVAGYSESNSSSEVNVEHNTDPVDCGLGYGLTTHCCKKTTITNPSIKHQKEQIYTDGSGNGI